MYSVRLSRCAMQRLPGAASRRCFGTAASTAAPDTSIFSRWGARLAHDNTYLSYSRNAIISTVAGAALVQHSKAEGKPPLAGAGLLAMGAALLSNEQSRAESADPLLTRSGPMSLRRWDVHVRREHAVRAADLQAGEADEAEQSRRALLSLQRVLAGDAVDGLARVPARRVPALAARGPPARRVAPSERAARVALLRPARALPGVQAAPRRGGARGGAAADGAPARGRRLVADQAQPRPALRPRRGVDRGAAPRLLPPAAHARPLSRSPACDHR
jgi:hypothetical protein